MGRFHYNLPVIEMINFAPFGQGEDEEEGKNVLLRYDTLLFGQFCNQIILARCFSNLIHSIHGLTHTPTRVQNHILNFKLHSFKRMRGWN